MQTQHQYFALYKPRNMVSQFISSHAVPLLGEIDYNFPIGTHAIGRLDKESEGLLLLTTDKSITNRLFCATTPHYRTYLVQVNHLVSAENIERMAGGIGISCVGNEQYITQPCTVHRIENISSINTLTPSMYDAWPHTWLQITLTEGKYHQVRKMVLAVGHKVRRLIRYSIENITIENMQPGEVKGFSQQEFYHLLKLQN